MNVIVKIGTEKGTGIGRYDEFSGFNWFRFDNAEHAVIFINRVQEVWDRQKKKETEKSRSAFIYGPPSVCIVPESEVPYSVTHGPAGRALEADWAANNFMDLERFQP